ncbi:MAG: M81 family metallopeptidase, partial [Deltaproteobacteria bacterium]|nr:M81 family metallopeptidase [Deltaproteobacteria bacterium]
VDTMIEREKQGDVLSLSLTHGFPWGDVAEAGTRMLVITDNDGALAKAVAAEFGQKIVDMRHEKLFDFMPVDAALSKAAASEKSPVVVADMADNPGGGAPSDSTFALEWLLAHDVTNAAIAFMWDPIVVQIAKSAGQGATLDVRLGGKMGPTSGNPLDLTVTVTGIKENYEYEVEFNQDGGEPMKIPAGDCAALNCRGIDIIVCSKRGQCFSPSAFSGFGIDPSRKKILIPKSTQHFYAAFAPIAEEVIYMSSPGALNALVAEIPYKVMDKNKYPWVDDPFNR